jgi:hypothetical protein
MLEVFDIIELPEVEIFSLRGTALHRPPRLMGKKEG